MSEMIKKLSEEMPAVAIQKTKGSQTHKGYDTTGYGYQTCVDRLNVVCGDKWGFRYDLLNHDTGTYKNGKPFHDITVNIDVWISDKENVRSCVGGHVSGNFADALKGAITNGFKKTVAFWGVGRAAYAGELDDDNKPVPVEEQKESRPMKEKGDYEKAVEVLGTIKDDTELQAVKNMLNEREWNKNENKLLREALKYAEKRLVK